MGFDAAGDYDLAIGIDDAFCVGRKGGWVGNRDYAAVFNRDIPRANAPRSHDSAAPDHQVKHLMPPPTLFVQMGMIVHAHMSRIFQSRVVGVRQAQQFLEYVVVVFSEHWCG